MTQRDINDTAPFGAELLAQARAQGVQLTPLNWTGFGKLSDENKATWRTMYGANPGQTSVQGPMGAQGFGRWYVTPGWAGVAQAPADLVKAWGTAFWTHLGPNAPTLDGIVTAATEGDNAVKAYLAASPSTAAQAYAMKPGVQRKPVGDGSKGRQSGTTVQSIHPIAAPAPGADVLGEARAAKASMEAAIARHTKALTALTTALTTFNAPESIPDGDPEEFAASLIADPTMTVPEGVYLTPPALAPGVYVVLTPALRALIAPVCPTLPPDGSTVGVVGIVAGPMVVLSLDPATGIVTPGGMYPAASNALTALARNPIVVPPSPPAALGG